VTDGFDRLRAALEPLTATRLAFRQHYESFLADHADPALPRTFLHGVWLGQRLSGGAGDAATMPDAAAHALLALGSDRHAAEALTGAVAAGLFDPPDADVAAVAQARSGAMGALASALGAGIAQATLQSASLERITSKLAGFPDPDRLVPAILLARRRLCRVETLGPDGRSVTGTGFLIGPSAVLTNWHVVKDVPSPLASGFPLTVLFDFSRAGMPTDDKSRFHARTDWQIEARQHGALEPADSSAGWWMDPAVRDKWATGGADHLDFAVVHLQGAPGLQRGWYDLARLVDTPLATGECFVFHHPLGEGRAGNAGLIHFVAGGSRLFHSATTARGSSGGLLVDGNGDPVGLHYLGLGPDAIGANEDARIPAEVINVAMPLAAIGRALAPKLVRIATADRPYLSRGSLDDGSPVFGRAALFETLAGLASGQKQVLRISPPSSPGGRKLGKSYTARIIQTLFPEPDNLYIHLPSDKLPAGERALAALLLSKISDSAAADLPEPETTAAAYDQVLVGKLRDIISERWPRKRIWMVIDDLDTHDLTDAGGRRFLNTLYARIGEIPQFRILLIGLKVTLDTIPPELLVENRLDLIEPQRLADEFRDWLLARGGRDKPLGDAAERILADLVKSYAGGETPLADLASFTRERLQPAFRAWFGE
jgi:hypothetical protein